MTINLSALQKQRRDTAANWTAENPTLLAGEIGLESDTGYWKVGDGATAWTSLAYVSGLGAEIPVDRLADGAARQLLQTDAAGTGVEWTDNVDVPGTLDVTGAGTFDGNVTIAGDLTVNGTTTTINTQDLLVEDKNIIIGNVTTPSDVTADGGGITLKGSTDKTINWLDATDAWTFSEHVNIASGKEYQIDGAKVLDATSLGSGVTGSSLTSVGTIGTGVWQGTAIDAAYLDSTVVTTGDTGTVTSTMIADGTIVDADVNASAAIAGTKISPDFGSQNITTTGTSTAASFTPTSSTVPTNGVYLPAANSVALSTNGTGRLFVDASGNVGVGTNNPQRRLHIIGPDGQVPVLPTVGAKDGFILENNNNCNLIFIAGAGFAAEAKFTVDGAGPAPGTIGYNHADNSLYFRVNSSERLRITSAGLVGIGNSSPGANLDIYTSASRYVRAFPSSGLADLEILSNNNSQPVFAVKGTGSADLFRAFANTTQAVTIDSSGRLGIGTTSPGYPLQVDTTGTGTAAGDNTSIYVQSQASGRDCNIRFGDSVNASARIGYLSNNLYFYVNGSERGRWDSSGRLLVGTSSVTGIPATLNVIGGNNTVLHTQAANADSPFLFLSHARGTGTQSVNAQDGVGAIAFVGYDGTNALTAARIEAFVDGTPGANDMPGRLVFSTTADGASSPTERMRISSTGAIITPSTATDAHFLGVNRAGNILSCNNAASPSPYGIGIGFGNASPNDAVSYFLECFDSTATRATIRSNGGLANYQANNVNLSDRNSKKDISSAGGTWDCIKEWEIVNYRYKDQPDDADLNLGVIAQQVAESCPEVITIYQEAKEATEDQPAQEERLGVKEQQMMWMAIKALQEAQTRIETLEAEVAALKAS